jgi:hypothetical protein
VLQNTLMVTTVAILPLKAPKGKLIIDHKWRTDQSCTSYQANIKHIENSSYGSPAYLGSGPKK